MAAKLVISIVTLVTMVVAGLAVLLLLTIGMNGVHESKAAPILVVYLVLAAVSSPVFAATSGWGSGAVAKATGWSPWAAGPLAVVLMSVAGGLKLPFGGIAIMLVLGVK